ncbi:3-oxoacyl-ACP synthase [Paenibacillus sp. CAA11]|uniref:ketoacyl-ACP synthase III n=1 Tax=Paenibacillus sp. CAA11 TaxID=1532905 RepID=UPI000D3C4A28|nr:ketoacyl-ACP synthase III [Paenibacillus sp. CAA11]AWB42875.1 3-oxoacyl-ACP synthase [Paenibacillus sp. CAA11]
MKRSIIITDTAIYHPDNRVENSYYIDHFDKQGKDIRRMLEAFGRESRYISDKPEENSLTMAIEASRRLLQKTGLTGADLDIIVFSSGTPEYIAPSNAIHIHHALEGKDASLVYDMNTNCVGMVIAMDQVAKYMQADSRIKRALIVGAEQMNRFSRTTNELTYPNFGDAACAVLLEAKDLEGEEQHQGFMDSVMLTKSYRYNVMALPGKGMSRIYDTSLTEEDKRIYWDTNDDGGASFLLAAQSIEELLERNQISKDQVKMYFLSQLSKKNISRVREELGEPGHKFKFVGDRYGYTGTSSPFLALHHAVEDGEIQRGDYILFWSVGAGSISSCALMKY